MALPACAYLNTFYNAEQAYDEGVRLKAGVQDSLPVAAREKFQTAAEKSATVLSRYPDSRYVDDALLLLGRSLQELGRYGDAAAAFQRLLDRFPDSELADRARLGIARSRRMEGDAAEARAALAPLLEGERLHGVEKAEVLYEKAMIDLADGDGAAAVETFRTLLDRDPGYAGREGVALRFADAELAAGDYDAALEAYRAFRGTASDPAARRAIGLRVARALELSGRHDEALDAYQDLLDAGLPDSLEARVHVERGEILGARRDWDAATREYTRAAELAPGSPVASRATLRRGRIVWHVQGDREKAQEILLDAFLHSPLSAWADSARTEARELADLLHYERLASGEEAVTALQDPALARSTALYRFAEDVLDVEGDADRAAATFEDLAARYPDSPWRPRALLSAGILRRRSGARAAGDSLLARVVERYPDDPAADSARRILGLPIPDRPPDFYAPSRELASLAEALPRASDPMIRIADQLDRYASRQAPGPGQGQAGTAQGGGEAGQTAQGQQILREPGQEGQPGSGGEQAGAGDRKLPSGAKQ